jgi:hypothetical protein
MVFVLVDIYLFASYKGTNYHLAVCIELSKIYSNSILLVHFSFGRRKKTRINSLDSRSSTRGHIWDTAAPTIRTTTPASICPLLYSVGANVQQLVLRLRLGCVSREVTQTATLGGNEWTAERRHTVCSAQRHLYPMLYGYIIMLTNVILVVIHDYTGFSRKGESI